MWRAGRFPCAAVLGCLLACPVIASEEVYRSVDKDGRPVFSDKPTTGSTPVDVRPPNTMQELAPAGPRATVPTAGETPPPPVYSTLRIASPENGGTVTNPAGNIVAGIELSPALQPGHRLQGLLDGQVSGMASDGGWLFPGTTRGPHTIEVQVLDGAGRALISSGTVNITLFRPVPRQKRSGAGP